MLGVSLGRVEEDVRGGAGLGLSLEKTGQFPTLLHQLVAVGEESGRTADILLKSAGPSTRRYAIRCPHWWRPCSRR